MNPNLFVRKQCRTFPHINSKTDHKLLISRRQDRIPDMDAYARYGMNDAPHVRGEIKTIGRIGFWLISYGTISHHSLALQMRDMVLKIINRNAIVLSNRFWNWINVNRAFIWRSNRGTDGVSFNLGMNVNVKKNVGNYNYNLYLKVTIYKKNSNNLYFTLVTYNI